MNDSLIVPVILVLNDEYWLPYALQATKGFFSRYVIYDVGSTDKTPDIIDWFKQTNPNVEFFHRRLDNTPHPNIQGIFRNSMIAEAGTDYFLILDGDEIYTHDSFVDLHANVGLLELEYPKLYGIVPRVEVCENLDQAYGTDLTLPHHRIYHRHAIFYGSHPGEIPVYTQKPKNEMRFDGPICYHFHNTERSSKEAEVPKRMKRKSQKTYHRGETKPFDLFEKLPMLKTRIENFPVNPVLERMWDKL